MAEGYSSGATQQHVEDSCGGQELLRPLYSTLTRLSTVIRPLGTLESTRTDDAADSRSGVSSNQNARQLAWWSIPKHLRRVRGESLPRPVLAEATVASRSPTLDV